MDSMLEANNDLVSAQNLFLESYFVPNFYIKEHFEEMKDWSDEKFDKFKEFMVMEVCCYDPFKELVGKYIDTFEEHEKIEEANSVAELASEPEPNKDGNIRVKKITYKDKKYLKEKYGNGVFDYSKFVDENESVLVGNWDNNLNIIVFN